MAEPSLQRPRVVPCIGQGIATGVPEHVRKDMEGHAGVLADALDQLPEGFGGHGAAALGLEDVRRCLLLALQAAQCAYLIALHWTHRRHAALAPADVQLLTAAVGTSAT